MGRGTHGICPCFAWKRWFSDRRVSVTGLAFLKILIFLSLSSF